MHVFAESRLPYKRAVTVYSGFRFSSISLNNFMKRKTAAAKAMNMTMMSNTKLLNNDFFFTFIISPLIFQYTDKNQTLFFSQKILYIIYRFKFLRVTIFVNFNHFIRFLIFDNTKSMNVKFFIIYIRNDN